LVIGPSSVRWAGDCLIIDIEEHDKRIMNPFRRRVAGQIKVWPEMLNTEAFALDPPASTCGTALPPRADLGRDEGAGAELAGQRVPQFQPRL
jgi:carotenoid 1,2-hydratase